jgi:hypothetical protein
MTGERTHVEILRRRLGNKAFERLEHTNAIAALQAAQITLGARRDLDVPGLRRHRRLLSARPAGTGHVMVQFAGQSGLRRRRLAAAVTER